MQRILRFVIPVVVLVALRAPVRAQPVITDALYTAHHPRLLFSDDEIPALRAKVTDGGPDDQAYLFIRTLATSVYPALSMADLLGLWYGDGPLQDLALVGHIETSPDPATLALGKAAVLYIVDTWEPDFDDAGSGMRLRMLAIGYDSFFADATETERGTVRDEMVRYIQKMIWNPGYTQFELQPYLGNHSAMVGAALGLASIALQGETETYVTGGGMAMADRIARNLLLWQFDAGGSYGEGVLYALWTLHNYVPYFDARKRFDGFRWGDDPRLHAVEEWLAYEMLPEGFARSHNLNDSPINSIPIARNSTCLDWAIHEWDSGISAWLWQHAVGAFGVDLGSDADKAATVLWHRSVTPTPPGDVLPPSRIWVGRGLYCFRTGWQSGMSSDDVLFSFFSGKFEGGHAQEDQNQFALYGYGERLVIDHGGGAAAKQSEAHNMVLIDGKGQHNAGQAIGTDGGLASYLLGNAADYVVGDASSAYATYSEYNAPDHPYLGADWSWGYSGANPVQFALRRVLTVRGAGAPPYFVIMDDIRKDNGAHDYQWRLHTLITNQVDTSSNPIVISGASGALDVHLLNPAPAALGVSVVDFDNGTDEADAHVLRVSCHAVEPRFAFLLVPRYLSSPGPVTTHTDYAWGWAENVDWGNGVVDRIVRNDSGSPVTHDGIESDALVTLVRRDNGSLSGYLVAECAHLSVDGGALVAVANGTMGCELSGGTLFVDRYDADFRVHDGGITSVRYRDLELEVTRDGTDIVRSSATAAPGPRATPELWADAYPNPFNPATTVRVRGDAHAHTRVVVYDVAGHRVRSLWDAPLGATERALTWDGRDDAGGGVASGVYFVRIATSSASHTLKVTLLK